MDTASLYRIFQKCTCVTTDSRNCPAGSLFIALKGDTFDGNAFAGRALESGSAYAIVDNPEYAIPGDNRYLLVDNGLHALQQLAIYHHRQIGTPVIAVTGTNGKTTTKELIAAILSRKYEISYTEGNLNNHIGVPLTLLRFKKEDEIAVVEMGASHPGDIKELVNIAEPDYGIITNVGKAHLQGFGSLEGVIRTKGELFEYLHHRNYSAAFVPYAIPALVRMAQGLHTVYYGCEEGLFVTGHATGNSPYLALEWKAKDHADEIHHIETKLIGEYNLPNVLAAITIGYYFGVEAEEIDIALQEYTPHNNRSQLQKSADNTLIIDAYNANPTSMMASIENFRKMEADHKLLILGDMRELGEESAIEHQKIVDYLEECGFKQVILVGEQFAATRHTYATYPDVQALTDELKRNKPKGQHILIKGSNGIRLSSIVPYL